MGHMNVTTLIAVLNMCKMIKIKPNFSQLSRESGLDRHTIAKYYEQGGKFDRKRDPKSSMFDPYVEEIEQLFSSSKVTVKGAFEYLKRTKEGFPGTYFSFRDFAVKHGHVVKGRKSPHPRYETGPGEQLQVDWKEDVRMTLSDGTSVTRQVFSATLGYSRLHFFVPAASKTGSEFARCLITVFRRLGGVPRTVLTDNMPAVVKVGAKGRRTKHPWILQLERDFGIEIRLCAPRTPETKGKVESSNRFISSGLAPYDGKLSSVEEVDAAIASVEERSNAEPNGTTGVPPLAMFRKEAPSLMPLPRGDLLDSYLACRSKCRVPQTMLVPFMGRWYSVPAGCIGREVTAYLSDGRVVILMGGEPVAEHDVSESKINYAPEHYAQALRMRGVDDGEIEEMAKRNLAALGGAA